MIDIYVFCALQLLDGFTGRPLRPAASRICVDGEPASPIRKDDGWVVLTSLSAAEHEIEISAHGFQTETLHLQPGAELCLRLKPSREYTCRAGASALTLQLKNKRSRPLAGKTVAFIEEKFALRLAQDDAVAGSEVLRLFTDLPLSRLPLPGDYVLLDGDKSEMLSLFSKEGATCGTLTPTHFAHARGCVLYAVRRYQSDAQGEVYAVLPTAGSVRAFAENADGTLAEHTLELNAQRECTLDWSL